MKKIKQWTVDWWFIGILILAAFLYAWNIWEAGNANDYYTAAITSMIQSWHNFWVGPLFCHPFFSGLAASP